MTFRELSSLALDRSARPRRTGPGIQPSDCRSGRAAIRRELTRAVLEKAEALEIVGRQRVAWHVPLREDVFADRRDVLRRLSVAPRHLRQDLARRAAQLPAREVDKRARALVDDQPE